MKQLTSDLWQTTIYNSGMLSSHAYLLKHPKGNVLFYNTNNEQDLLEIDSMGGVQFQFLTHRDEATPSLKALAKRYSCQLGVSEKEKKHIDKYHSASIVIDSDEPLLGDIQVIHTPGHTDGSLCYYYTSPNGMNYLFTGDTLFQWEGEWSTLVLSGFGGSVDSLTQSLLKLKKLQPDLVISSGFVGTNAYVETNHLGWKNIIDSAVHKLSQ